MIFDNGSAVRSKEGSGEGGCDKAAGLFLGGGALDEDARAAGEEPGAAFWKFEPVIVAVA